MIELMVGCVLIGLVVAMAASSIIRGFSNSAETASSSLGRAKAAEAAEQLGSDIRGVRSKGRDGAQIAEVSDLVKAVRTDGVLYDIAGEKLDWRDVTVAARDTVTFHSDVVDEAAGGVSLPECVTWSVQDAQGGWYVRRVTRAYTVGCAGGGGAVYEDDEVTKPVRATVLPRPGTGTAPPLFSYVLAQATVDGCATAVVSRTLTSAERNRVVGMRIDFSSLVAYRDQASRAALRDEVSIRSRSSADYQLALGCDEE